MYIICCTCINKRTVETRDIIIYFLFLLLSLYNGIQKIALEWHDISCISCILCISCISCIICTLYVLLIKEWLKLEI